MLRPELYSAPRSPHTVALTAYPNVPFLATLLDREFCHVILLPVKWPADSWFLVAARQAAANRLPTFLVTDRRSCIEFLPDGGIRAARLDSQWGWTLQEGRLAPAVPISETDDVEIRHALFEVFAKSQHGETYVFGDLEKGGRAADRVDIQRLGGCGADGDRPGLETCAECGRLRGEVLERSTVTRRLLVLPVACRCDNDNRCACCGELLAERKLCANEYDSAEGKFRYTPGFTALSHCCDLDAVIEAGGGGQRSE